jgi:hypothetical protein
MSIPTAENAGATEPRSIVAAIADSTHDRSRDRFTVFGRLPRESVGIFTFSQPPFVSGSHRGRAGLTLRPKAGSRNAFSPFQECIPTIERNGYEWVALTISPRGSLTIADSQSMPAAACQCPELIAALQQGAALRQLSRRISVPHRHTKTVGYRLAYPDPQVSVLAIQCELLKTASYAHSIRTQCHG